MTGWALLVAAVAVNYSEHRQGRSTICSTSRRRLPRPVLLGLYGAGAVSLGVHLARGYQAAVDVLQEIQN